MDEKQEETTYYAVHVIQDDKRPVAIFRYEESAIGFINRAYKNVNIAVRILPIKLNTKFLENNFR